MVLDGYIDSLCAEQRLATSFLLLVEFIKKCEEDKLPLPQENKDKIFEMYAQAFKELDNMESWQSQLNAPASRAGKP